MPASVVTSVYSIGPDGRGGVGLGEREAAAVCSTGAFVVGAFAAGCLQAESNTPKHAKRQHKRLRGVIRIEELLLDVSVPPAIAGGYVVDALGSKGNAPTRYREVVLTVSKFGSEPRDSNQISISIAVGPTRNSAYSGACTT